MKRTDIIIALLLLIPALPAVGADTYLIREEFDTLDAWTPLYFPKIPGHSVYTIGTEGATRYLKCESAGSASAIIHTRLFNAYETPNIEWRWRIERVYDRGDETEKSGDDYTLRIYIMFKYDPEKAGIGERMQYGAIRLIYGEYPPHSSLNYIWANRDHSADILVSPYTDRSRMILVEKTGARAGEWITERAHFLNDYRRAFGADPPVFAGIAVMNDSDNTGESSVSYLDYLYVY